MVPIEERSRVLHELASQAVPDTVDVWPALNARLLRERRHSEPPPIARWAGLVAAGVVVIVVIALGLVAPVSAPEAVSAEMILDRAELAGSTATSAVSTYHLLMTRSGRDAGSTRSEVWFAGPDRQRTIQQMLAANGAVLGRQDVVFNGPETWIEDTQNDTTRVIHTIGTTWTRPAESPSSEGNLSELLKSFGDKTCMSVSREQTDSSVAGQPTYVVVATPRMPACGGARPGLVEPSPGPRIRVNGQPVGSEVSAPAHLTIWVDKRSFLPLRMEARDSRGMIVDRSEVTSVEYSLSIPAATFAYTPPAGVTVATFTGGDGADVKRALASEAQPPGPPIKSP